MDKPKYDYGDVLIFHMNEVKNWDGETVLEEQDIEGVVEIIDRYGTFEQNEEPSYDLYNKERNTLFKHIRQSAIIKKVRVASEDERLK